MNSNFRAAEKYTYVVPEDGDPRWAEIFDQAPKITIKFHGPLPPGQVSDLMVMFTVRVLRPDGYDETVYFANQGDLARWSVPKVDKKMASYNRGSRPYHEKLALQHPDWTVSQMLDYVEGLP